MIERIYIKSLLNFEKIELDLKEGLTVFTGPSGAGKSVLFGQILALFGKGEPIAGVCEAQTRSDLPLEKYGIESEEVTVIRFLKRENTRYFVNSQAISKKRVKELFDSYLIYLGQRERETLSSENILKEIDLEASSLEGFDRLKSDYQKAYEEFSETRKRLKELSEKEKRVTELIEFAKYEIHKIESVSPRRGEYEELMEIKRRLSKAEKIKEAIDRATAIFEYEDAVYTALDRCERKSDVFFEGMNEIRAIFEETLMELRELENSEIEEILDRIEKLSELKRRYGSVEEALEYLERKKAELRELENMEFEKESLRKRAEEVETRLREMAAKLSDYRARTVKKVKNRINLYTKELRLSEADILWSSKELDREGIDRFEIVLGSAKTDQISSGEFNRLRLAFMAAQKEERAGVLVLDEIDANLSGEESMGVAKVLKKISKRIQVLAISHQPQLSSTAEHHFLVRDNEVVPLDYKERIKEIARMISGEKVTQKALNFAKEMLKKEQS